MHEWTNGHVYNLIAWLTVVVLIGLSVLLAVFSIFPPGPADAMLSVPLSARAVDRFVPARATVVSSMPADLSDLSAPIQSPVRRPPGNALAAMPLLPKAPRECEQLDSLRTMQAADLFGGEGIASRDDAECVRSGLFLYFSALDESHRISQGIATSSGSYWHGIMHRQEGDWSNAKYWFPPRRKRIR